MLNCFNSVYKGKKVLITGHTGFKGTWLTVFLKQLGAEILGYSVDIPTNPSLFDIIFLKDKIVHVKGDILDENRLLSTFQDFQPEFVFHMAAQPLVRLSYSEPKLTYETNVIGTVNLLEAVRKTKSVRVVINVTSDKCYENKEWVHGYREVDSLGGDDPYSSSKGCAEIITSAYRSSFFHSDVFDKHIVSLSSVRSGNVIGGGDWAGDRLIPDCVRAIIEKKDIIVRHPKYVRPWQHVLEPLSGYLCLGSLMLQDCRKYGCAWNFGPLDSYALTVEDIVVKVIEDWQYGHYVIDNGKHLHESSLLSLDCRKAMAILNWRPVFDVYTAISKTVQWYKEYYSEKNRDMYGLTIKQIKSYIEEARKMNILWSLR